MHRFTPSEAAECDVFWGRRNDESITLGASLSSAGTKAAVRPEGGNKSFHILAHAKLLKEKEKRKKKKTICGLK